MIHIGYGDSAAGCLREAIDNHGLAGDDVIPSRDDLTQGPLMGSTSSAFGHRVAYWAMIDEELDFGMNIEAFYNESIMLLESIQDDTITIWQGDSAHDILATSWLVTYFRDRDITWQIIDLSVTPLEEGDIPAVNVAMYQPCDIVALYDYRQILGPDGMQMYHDLWNQMTMENGSYRVMEDREILSVGAEFHDASILAHIPRSFALASKTIGNIMGSSKHTLSDTTVEWRIRRLIKSKEIEYRGELKSMFDYEVRRGGPTNA